MHATVKPSAADRVYRHVKDAILHGEYVGGVLLTEGEIALAVAVSRTPVREALLRLEAEGLVRLYPKKGALVVPVSSAEADSILEARALIETWAVPRVLARREALAAELEPLLAEMRAHQEAGRVNDFSAVDRTFHERIVAAAGNELVARFYASLRERQLCINAATVRVDNDRMIHAISDHTAILDALRVGDGAALAELTTAHLDRATRYMRGLQ